MVAKGHELLLSEMEARDPCSDLPKELLRSAESILNRLAKLDDELRELGIDLRGKRHVQ